jgi:hypothetical protein
VALDHADSGRRRSDARIAADSSVDEEWSISGHAPRFGELVLEPLAHVIHRAHRAIQERGRMQAWKRAGLVCFRCIYDLDPGLRRP